MQLYFFGQVPSDNIVEQARGIFQDITGSFLSGRSILMLIIALTVAAIVGRLLAAVMRRLARAVSRTADKVQDLKEVNRLRRIETLIILAVALIRMLLFIVAVYFWWVLSHPNQQPSALIGASALAIIVGSATLGPILRDLAYGGVMMAEHWFGVGDHIRVEPFSDLQGIVERVTLRSTRIRGINGEIIWISNQNIQGVRVLTKGVRTTALEIFVDDLQKGMAMLEATNMRLPTSPLMVVRPLHIMSKSQVGERLWHITAVGETAPGREWLLQKYAGQIMKELDEENKHQIMLTDPIAHDADSDAELRFARTVQNARKSSLQHKRLPLPEAIAHQLEKPFLARARAKKVSDTTQSAIKRRKKTSKKIQ